MHQDPIDQLLEVRRRAAGEVIEVDEAAVKLVIFRLGDGMWTIRGKHVREILPPGDIFFVPGCPDSIEGVINVRGDIASVVRLARLLGIGGEAPRAPGAGDSILLGHGGGMLTGLRVGEVIDVADVPESAILPPPPNLDEGLRPVVEGALTFADRPVTLIDLDRLLARYRAELG